MNKKNIDELLSKIERQKNRPEDITMWSREKQQARIRELTIKHLASLSTKEYVIFLADVAAARMTDPWHLESDAEDVRQQAKENQGTRTDILSTVDKMLEPIDTRDNAEDIRQQAKEKLSKAGKKHKGNQYTEMEGLSTIDKPSEPIDTREVVAEDAAKNEENNGDKPLSS